MPSLPQKLWLDDHVSGRHFSLRSNDMGTMLQASLGGFGIALLPDFLVRGHSQLIKLQEGDGAPIRPLFLVMHPDRYRVNLYIAVTFALLPENAVTNASDKDRLAQLSWGPEMRDSTYADNVKRALKKQGVASQE